MWIEILSTPGIWFDCNWDNCKKSVGNNEIEGCRKRRKCRGNYDTKNDGYKFCKKRMDTNDGRIVTQSSMDTDCNQAEEIVDIDLHFLKVF